MTALAEEIRVQVIALTESWQQAIEENRQTAARCKRESTTEGSELARYHQGYADALDRCRQALKLLAAP